MQCTKIQSSLGFRWPLVYDWSKKRSPLNVVLEVEKVADQVVDDGEAQQKADREEQLRKAIARLPAEKSELIFWTKIEGMKYEDVANIKVNKDYY